mmetsp:Transcript_21049/g.58480  ORF Transcript_21049/g.58480 Transcript_21049/m.58480 type:complete len:89 (-) Transcript_21049:785-1051(-)
MLLGPNYMNPRHHQHSCIAALCLLPRLQTGMLFHLSCMHLLKSCQLSYLALSLLAALLCLPSHLKSMGRCLKCSLLPNLPPYLYYLGH